MKKQIVFALLLGLSFQLSAQKPQEDTPLIDIDKLPEYVVITSENTKLLGGINITIDYKKSDYADVLEELEFLLQNKKKLRIRNQTDLLNALSALGFEYINAFNATAGTLGAGAGEKVEVFGSESKYRINMVFRKKKENSM